MNEKPTIRDVEAILERYRDGRELSKKQSTPQAVATDVTRTVRKQGLLESLLDELLLEGWEELAEEELLRIADINCIQWHETNSGESRIIAGVIWELTGNVKKIEKLGYIVPWWYENLEINQ